MNVALQVEQQFSHKFTVTVVRAESVTKGALGDLCESSCQFMLHTISPCHSHPLLLPENTFNLKKQKKNKPSCLKLQCVGSGHPRPVCGTVHPNGSGEQKKDQTHRQQHQSSMERDLHLHLGPQSTECLGGWFSVFHCLFFIFLSCAGPVSVVELHLVCHQNLKVWMENQSFSPSGSVLKQF